MKVPTERRAFWDAKDQLLMEALIIAVMAVAILGALVTIVADLVDRELTVPADLEPQRLEGVDGVVLTSTEGTVQLKGVSLGEVALASLPTVLGVAVVLTAGWMLLKIVRSLRAGGDPFHRHNARRLTIAAVVVLIGGLVASGADALVTMALTTTARGVLGDVSVLVPSGTLSFVAVPAGLLLLCLSEFFRRGARLRDDVEGLV